MHSMRLEPTKLILVGTRTTYQATGDAGLKPLDDPRGTAPARREGINRSKPEATPRREVTQANCHHLCPQ